MCPFLVISWSELESSTHLASCQVWSFRPVMGGFRDFHYLATGWSGLASMNISMGA